MEKDILIQNLRAKVGEDNCKSISDKTFEGIANVYLPMFADDSKITDDLWKLPVAALNEFAGQKRHDEKEFAEKFKSDYAKEYAAQHEKDVAERIRVASEKAVEEYKKANPTKEGEGGASGGGDGDIDTKVNEAIAKALQGLTGKDSELGKLQATLSEFVKNQTEREKNAAKNRVREDLKKHLLNLKANNEACIDDALGDIEYGDAPTFDGLKQSAISAYEKRYKRYYGDGGKPFGGDSTGGSGGGDNSYVQKKIEELKQDAADSAKYAAEMEKTFE